MKQIIAVILMVGLVLGCSQRRGMAKEEQEPAIKRQAAQPSPLVSLIGMKWDVVWKRLSSDGVTILGTRTAEDGTVEYILQNHEKRFGNVRLFVKDGVIDEVEAWAVNAMAPRPADDGARRGRAPEAAKSSGMGWRPRSVHRRRGGLADPASAW